MSIISMVLLAVLPLLLAEPAQAFFSSCPASLTAPATAPNATQMREAVKTMFPASVYLKKGRSGETDYSCITLTTFDTPQITPNLYPVKRFFLDFGFGAGLSLAPAPPVTYNVAITYYLLDLFITSYGNISIVEESGGVVIKLAGLPINLFGESSGKASLRVASAGKGYFILIDCRNYLLSYAKYTYMLAAPQMNKTDLQALDWRCMAGSLEELTDTHNILPGGICTASA